MSFSFSLIISMFKSCRYAYEAFKYTKKPTDSYLVVAN